MSRLQEQTKMLARLLESMQTPESMGMTQEQFNQYAAALEEQADEANRKAIARLARIK